MLFEDTDGDLINFELRAYAEKRRTARCNVTARL